MRLPRLNPLQNVTRLLRLLTFPSISLFSSWGALPDLLVPPPQLPPYPATLAPLLPPEATPELWKKTRQQLDQSWRKWLGDFPAQKAPLQTEFHEKESLPGFTRQRVTYQLEPGSRIDAMVLLPEKREGKLPTIVLFHPTYDGHYKRAVGIEGSEEPERQQAVQWVQAGYAVIAPRCFLWEELPADFQKLPNETLYATRTRHALQTHPSWKGITRMAWDGIRALDFAETLPEVDPKRIAIFGHSLGAKEVLYVGAFDPRPRCVVSSEGGIGMRHSNWNASWYLGPEIREPGFPKEHHELLALIAPRPFLLLAGGEGKGAADTPDSWHFIQATLPVYRLLGAPGSLGWLNHGLGHRYAESARSTAEAFIQKHLAPTP